MSRWLTDELHISLSPDQVGLALVRRDLSIKGVKRSVIATQTLPCQPATQASGWSSSLHAMDKLLAEFAESKAHVSIVLSNHFVRYALVPWSDLISSDEQQQAYTQHCFKMTYGVMSTDWQLRISRSTVGSAQLASAVENMLLQQCGEIVLRHGLKLHSVQPYLMSAFNRLKLQFEEADAWFALVEQGNICLAQLQQGKWVGMRSARLGHGWGEFARFLQRETFMGGSEIQAEEKLLYVYAPHMGPLQSISGWKICALPAPLSINLPEGTNNSLIMALSGTNNGAIHA